MEEINNFEEPLFPISVAAKLLDISVQTLRMYEKEGLIIPFRKETNHRLYSKADIARIICIRNAINNSKISIAGIKTIYSLIPCWEIMNCREKDRENCEAFTSYNSPCWSLNHKNNPCENLICRECIVYKNFSECKAIKKSITSLAKKNDFKIVL